MPFTNTVQRFLALQDLDVWRQNQLAALPDGVPQYERAAAIYQHAFEKLITAANRAEQNRSLSAEGRAERLQAAAKEARTAAAADTIVTAAVTDAIDAETRLPKLVKDAKGFTEARTEPLTGDALTVAAARPASAKRSAPSCFPVRCSLTAWFAEPL